LTIFIDTGVFEAFHNKKDERHAKAREIISHIIRAEFGATFTSDYVFDEAVTLALARTGRGEAAMGVGRMILGESSRSFIVLLRVGQEEFRRAWALFGRYSSKGLSFTDCSSLALMETMGIERMATFDSHFDGIASVVR
jgi:predicted nucleic acid-binding protein